jgi:hypothetical protein
MLATMGSGRVAAAALVFVVGTCVGASARAQDAPPPAPAPAPAPAPPPERDLAAAEQAYVDLDFEKANALADGVVKRGGLTHALLVRAYELLGRTHAILNHDDAARDAFVKLLTYSPSEKEDRNLPPRVTVRMEEARGALAGYTSMPGIELTPSLLPGDGGTLRVTTRDPTHVVQRIVVGWRWGTGGVFSTATPVAGEAVELPLSSAPPGAARLDYYANAYDDRGDVVFEVGNPDAPKTALVPVPPAPTAPPPALLPGPASASHYAGGKSIFASPVFWAVAGGVVVAAGTGLFFVLRKPRDETLPPTGSELSPVLLCNGNRCP